MYHHVRTKLQIPFRYLEPTFFSGLLDDPLVLLRNRPAGSNMLFDCGQIHHLAKRVLKAVDSVFISHAHMDHFMGMASFGRNILVSTKTINIYGPPDLSVRLEKLLAGFDWNLCENFWCSFRVNEIFDKSIKTFILPGPDGFRRQEESTIERVGSLIYENRQVKISAAICDHKIPSVIYRIEEQPAFIIDDDKLRKAGLLRGDWLRELNSRFNQGKLDCGPIKILKGSDQDQREIIVDDPADLFRKISADAEPASIGYLCDIGYTPQNLETIRALFTDLTILVAECTYSAEDVDRARISYHLCTSDLNEIMKDLRPEYVLPIHVSKSYNDNLDRIFDELNPPAGTTLLRLPDHIVPRPYLPDEIPGPEILNNSNG